jgi:2-polyprenyl-3-methyl-5-hydroxy-6-metoxy-1,4-benzoquinol methylase
LSPVDSAIRVAFIPGAAAPDYLQRLGRLRWRRAFGAASAAATPEDATAAGLAGASVCVLVRDERALPAPVSAPLPLPSGAVLPCAVLTVAQVPPTHTLRELEDAGLPLGPSRPDPARVPAIAFRPAEVPAAPGETLSDYGGRLFGAATGPVAPAFRALVFDDPSEHARPELLARLPEAALRLCDVGCAAGVAGAAWKRASGGHVTGIENDARAAAIARGRLDRVLESDARTALARLAREGEVFDAFLFADVLEHVEDPIGLLALARRLAAPGACLVASVPNVGHLSLVRDLILGRFDLLPAGLLDAGHLRWFTRRWLEEALEEAGWKVAALDALPGAPAPDAERFLGSLSAFPGLDRESLTAYQWAAVAFPDDRRP